MAALDTQDKSIHTRGRTCTWYLPTPVRPLLDLDRVLAALTTVPAKARSGSMPHAEPSMCTVFPTKPGYTTGAKGNCGSVAAQARSHNLFFWVQAGGPVVAGGAGMLLPDADATFIPVEKT